MSEPGDGHGPGHTGQEARKDASPEHRMRKRIIIYTVPVYQSTSGLMEEARVDRNTRNIWPKSRLPDVAGNRPWWKKLSHILQGK